MTSIPRLAAINGGDGANLLDVFLALALDPVVAERDVVLCADSAWSYSDLDAISTAIASEVRERYGCGSESSPTVAIICENHPYTLVLFLAIWKLGGIIAPLDHHAPPELMKSMLQNAAPTYVVMMKGDLVNGKIVQDLSLPVEYIEGDQYNVASLTQRFLHRSPDEFNFTKRSPRPEDIALYIYTSSASSIHNLKCVPLSHGSLVKNGRTQLSWFKNNIPGVSLEHLRVLGWSPFSHAMSMCSDFGTHVLLTGGCYIFGITPLTYTSGEEPVPSVQDQRQSVAGQLLSSILQYSPDVFAGVPWIFDGMIAALEEVRSGEDTAYQKKATEALARMQYIISAGAATSEESIQWAKEHNIVLINSIGMTETEGPLFHSHASEVLSGWDIQQSCIPDATFALFDENEDISTIEGELYITSKNLPRGYLNLKTDSFRRDSSTGVITFKTGDIYIHPQSDPTRLIWKGRKDDFIQLKSGESLDPRNIEKTLCTCPIVAHACVIGNTFLSKAADFVCALIELTPEGRLNFRQSEARVSKILASVNRTLVPPLRIAWSRVLFLDTHQQIPYTRKHVIFRKRLEDLFGQQLLNHLTNSHVGASRKSQSPVKPIYKRTEATFTKEDVDRIAVSVVSRTLGITEEILHANSQSTFAELGMDSAMATIIINDLNQRLSLSLPPNTCHNHIDLKSLISFLYGCLESLPTISPVSSPAPPPTESASGLEPIAVVGYALRLPGDINDSEALWNALVERRTDILTPTPADRWDHASFQEDSSCKITFEKSGFIDLAHFDNIFFGIPATEAISVSPITRLTLETAFEALERANIPISKVKGTNMAVFVAAGLDPGYGELLFQDRGYDSFNRFYGTGNATSTACGRLSYLLDIHGPSMTVETACSGSFVALDQAVRHLQSGRGDAAIICGVNTHTLPGMFGFMSAQKMTSTNSRCATFSNEADGYATAEGVVSIIAKTQTAALRDGDRILGLIKATDTMHNGKTQGLVAPSVHAQAMLQRSLLRLSNLNPADIDLIETHGTGTSLGDLIEIQGINEVFRDSHTPSRPLLIGAAKSCIGHTETASGLVGLVKTLSSFEKNAVPGIVHLNETNLNPSIDCSIIPMHIPCSTVNLRRGQNNPYKALVVSYGFAGTISGVVVEGPPALENAIIPNTNGSCPMVFAVSAKTQAALLAYIQLYLTFCSKAPATSFQSICYTSCVGREYYLHRFACAVPDLQDLILKLRERLSKGSQPSNHPNPHIILGFPGQGSQYRGMAKDLASRLSGFRDIVTEYASLAASLSGYPILALLLETNGCDVDIDESQIAQVCIFVYQSAVVRWLGDLGIEADAVVGHSLGEIAAAVYSGALDFVAGLQLVIARAGFLKSTPYPGAMVAVVASEATIQRCIEALELQDRVVIAVYGGIDSHVISGSAEAIETVCAAMKSDGIRCAKVKVDQGFHSPSIANGLPALQTWLEEHESLLKPLKIPFYSTSIGERISPHQYLRPSYWVNHAKNPVKLSQTAARIGSDKTLSVFLDVGPQPTMWAALQNQNISEKVLLCTTAKAGKDQEMAFLESVAKLFENRVHVDLHKLYEQHNEIFSKTAIPTYPYQRQRHYPDFIPSGNQKSNSRSAHKSPSNLFTVDQPLLDLLHDHRIEGRRVLPGAAFGDFLARLDSNNHRCVQSVRFHQPLVLENCEKLVQISQQLNGSFTVFQNGSTDDQDRLCSGILSSNPINYSRKAVNQSELPIHTLKQDIYRPFAGNIHFGPAFRNVTGLSVWPDHIEAQIEVPPSLNPTLDRIRKLDPCLHLLGALVPLLDVPESMGDNGFYLPTSLEGFSLYTDELPSSIICRYFLPFDISSNYRTMSTSLEAFSPSGELLMSCNKYSVAWLPKGVAVRAPLPAMSSRQWMRNTWRQEDVLAKHRPPKQNGGDETVLYISSIMHANLLAPFSTNTSEIIFVELNGNEKRIKRLKTQNGQEASHVADVENTSDLIYILFGKQVSIVLETSSLLSPHSLEFSAFWKHVLWLMKLTLNGKIRIASFVVVSYQALPISTSISSTTSPSLGAIVQGLLRVYRSEFGLQRCVVWGLDLTDSLTSEEMFDIITSEIDLRKETGEDSHSVTAYRTSLNGVNGSLMRLVPVLLPMDKISESSTTSPAGVTIIVGMGSIGSALGLHLANAKCKALIFIGRRPSNDPTIVGDFQRLQSRSNCSGVIDYIQADATDLSMVRHAFNVVQSRFGPINNIIYTAGVVHDARIDVVKEEDFERVLNSKVIGAWNVHLVSQELNLNPDAFVLLSSISVPLGNPGQAAYVAANSFLDSLAAYRQSLGFRGTSLQLGAWESPLIDGIDLSHSGLLAMSHEEGIPLIMQAMMSKDPVQLIAKIDVKTLQQTPTFARDPLFRELFVNRVPDTKRNHKDTSYSKAEAKDKIINILKSLLMLKSEDELELGQSLSSFGIDSISFAQARGQVLQSMGLEIPMLYLSDSFSVGDMISAVCKDLID